MGVVKYVKNDFLQTLGEQQQELFIPIILKMVISKTLLIIENTKLWPFGANTFHDERNFPYHFS